MKNNYNLEKLSQNQINKTLEEFSTKYMTHENGLFILAPSGAGKTYFVDHQTKKNWIDGDKLWTEAGAQPNRAWWLEGMPVISEIDRRCDKVTEMAKEKGLWIMGASNNYLKPDAIVIPDWEEHKKLIYLRETTNYDGGATSDRLDQVVGHRKWILEWEKKGVPKFESIREAVDYLTSSC